MQANANPMVFILNNYSLAGFNTNTYVQLKQFINQRNVLIVNLGSFGPGIVPMMMIFSGLNHNVRGKFSTYITPMLYVVSL